jgi:hypothetical protein
VTPLRKETDWYKFAKQNLSREARRVLDLIEEAIADGAPDYPGFGNRTVLPGGVVVVYSGGVTVSFLPGPDGVPLMLNVEDDTPGPWELVE